MSESGGIDIIHRLYAEERNTMNAIKDNTHDEDERRLFVEDVVKTIQDDVSGKTLNDIIIDESLIEKNLHFEDIHQQDHLNKDIDINDIRIENVLRQIQQIDIEKYSKIVDATYIRKMCDSTKEIRMHMDSGANRSITDDDRLLYDVRHIEPYYMHGAQSGDADIVCTKVGYLRLACRGGGSVKVKVFFSPNISETILSPGDITTAEDNNFVKWEQICDHGEGTGSIRFSSRSGIQQSIVDTYLRNGIWYARQSFLDCITPAYIDRHHIPIPETASIKRMTAAETHELWHQRLCHPGKTVSECIHKTSDGVPKLSHGRSAFYKCTSCLKAKVEKGAKLVGSSEMSKRKVTGPGQHFQMDFGFARGSDYSNKNEKGQVITSKDGYNSYLLIVDKFTGYIWVMLSCGKDPPLDFVKDFLKMHKDEKCKICTIRTDQGGELWKSFKFRDVIREAKCIAEPTGADDPAQNGTAERPNQTFARMMRSMLCTAGLGSEYWSYAFLHAVYIKNRLPHSLHGMKMSPYESLTGLKPDLSQLKVWGCRVTVKMPGKRKKKLDDLSTTGIFLRYTATNKNIVYLDLKTNQEKIASHVVFDESNFTSETITPGYTALMKAGKQKSIVDSSEKDSIKFRKLHPNATLPKRATASSAGLDLYAIEDFEIQPQTVKPIRTGIAVALPKNTYGRIAPTSGNTVKKKVDIRAGVVDQDFRGEILAVMQNIGSENQKFLAGDKIAQLIIEQCKMSSPLQFVNDLDTTERAEKGFGSTDVIRHVHDENEMSMHNIILSDNIDGPHLTVTSKVRGNDPLLGLELDEQTSENRLILLNCRAGTPTAKIPRWRSQLRGAYLRSIDGTPVATIEEAIAVIKRVKSEQAGNKKKDISFEFQTVEKIPMHPMHGTPQIYFDQLNILAEHQYELKQQAHIVAKHVYHDEESHEKFESIVRKLGNEDEKSNQIQENYVPDKLTRKYLMKQKDWLDWKMSEFKQLQQYEQQQMFGPPEPRPSKANILSLLWTYLVKADGTKKSRCCCNGNPGRKGSITLALTYAACVEQPAQRIYWAIVATEGYIAIGADASNAFAEAPPPKAPLYVMVDRPYREWWKETKGEDIPKGSVLRVQHAIQGHPEAPRLWSVFIDEIIQTKIKLTPTTHEQCLYHGEFQGKKVLFLRQVDDFSVAAEDEQTCKNLIMEISKYLKAPLKMLGIVDRFNGIQIEQTNTYVKLHNEQYIEKILHKHGWLNDKYKSVSRPIPMRYESKYIHDLETSKGPVEAEEKQALEHKMKFSYRQALGEALYAMVTCRPDISVAISKLSQYANSPAEIHYGALKNVFRYLRATKSDGIYYWRKKPLQLPTLQKSTLPKMYSDEKECNEIKLHMRENNQHKNNAHLMGYVDSDWAGDVSHRRSITGIAIFYGGAVIAYKSKFQKTVALSSTEAEFAAACEAGKIILYLRTILEELGMEQEKATILYEDNQGALMMANASQPTRRTRHVDTASFALLDWVSRDLLELTYTVTAMNNSDGMTKPLGRILFYKHFDRIMGRVVPDTIRNEFLLKNKQQMNDTSDHTEVHAETFTRKEHV